MCVINVLIHCYYYCRFCISLNMCVNNVLNHCYCSTGFTFLLTCVVNVLIQCYCSTGFAFLFMVMVPVPRVVKIGFHVFGAVSLVISLAHIVLTSKAAECVS